MWSLCTAVQAGCIEEPFLYPISCVQYAEGIISKFYVDSVDRDTIVDEAIRAMLKTLDPHSAYSTPEETRELNEPLNGNFSGVLHDIGVFHFYTGYDCVVDHYYAVAGK